MRHRFTLLAALAGIALAALFGAAQPAGADEEVDCIEVFVPDPSVCRQPA